MYAEFGWPGLEDEPPAVSVDVRPPQNIAEELTSCMGIVGIDQCVNGGNHPKKGTSGAE